MAEIIQVMAPAREHEADHGRITVLRRLISIFSGPITASHDQQALAPSSGAGKLLVLKGEFDHRSKGALLAPLGHFNAEASVPRRHLGVRLSL